jgi:hypothetical protein
MANKGETWIVKHLDDKKPKKVQLKVRAIIGLKRRNTRSGTQKKQLSEVFGGDISL